MPPAATSIAPVFLVHGDDEFAVKQRGRQMFQQWSTELGGMDHEIIDAQVSNSGEALKALARLREGLQTLPFFGSGKVIWLQNCSFLGDDRTATSQAVNETLGDLAQELKAFAWQNVRLLISAGKVDKRKTFFKTLEKLGTVEAFALSCFRPDLAYSPQRRPSRSLCPVGFRIVVFEARPGAPGFIHITACLFAESLKRSFPSKLRRCHYFHPRFDCYRPERPLAGRVSHPLKKHTESWPTQ